MRYYQVIDFINEEPLKIGASGNKTSWTEPCKDFIPGSTVRGGMIAQMLQQRILGSDELAPILRNLVCYNAYPLQVNANSLESERSYVYFPAPLHLRMDKHKARRAIIQESSGQSTSIKLNNMLEKPTETQLMDRQAVEGTGISEKNDETEGAKNNLLYSYVAIKDELLQGMKINKAYHQHHSQKRNVNRREKENLFSYQAIQPGYTFRAVIMYDEQIASSIQKLLSRSVAWYLGGSKGSGYGKCRIELVDGPVTDFISVKQLLYRNASQIEQLQRKQAERSSKQLVITCLSDCLYRDEQGQPVNYIPQRYFHKWSGGKLSATLVKQFVQTSLSEGFNSKWFARYPKETTIKAGSVFVYELTPVIKTEESQLSLLQQLIAEIEAEPTGQRIQDGFGWLAANLPYPQTLAVTAAKDLQRSMINLTSILVLNNQVSEHAPTLVQQMNEDELMIMNILQKGLQDTRQKWLQMIVKRSLYAHKNSDNLHILSSVKSSQANNMKSLIEKWLSFDEAERSDILEFNQTIFDRVYAKDNQYLSFAKCNFKELFQYLTDTVCPKDKRDCIQSLAIRYLTSSSGKLYYMDAQSLAVQKLFIAELLYEGLQYHIRRCKNEQST